MNVDGVYLGTPQNVEIKALSGKKAEVTWSAVPGSTRYIVYRKKQGDKKYFRAAVTIGTRFEDSNFFRCSIRLLPGKSTGVDHGI